MAPVRIRHPKGTSTLQIPFEDEAYTVQDLQQEIYAASEILPSQQSLKTGYPPKNLTLIPELPLSSLGLQPGDQIIVSGNVAAPPPAQARPPPPAALPTVPVQAAQQAFIPGESSTDGPEHVETQDGVMIHRVVPDDNSCLFSAVALIFEQDMSKSAKLRQIVADGIKQDPETYNEAILGMSPSKYIATITKPSTWGGAIELGILANHYRTEIASIDVETGRIDYFTPPADNNGGMRCIILYSGIHYDAVTVAPMLEAPPDWHQTVFPVLSNDDSDPIIAAAKQLATKLREKKAFTNTSSFTLKCEDCGKGLTGEKEARQHAAQTGHVRLSEY